MLHTSVANSTQKIILLLLHMYCSSLRSLTILYYFSVIWWGQSLYEVAFVFLKCDELAPRTSKDLKFPFLPSPLTQNLDKNINSFHIQVSYSFLSKNSLRIPKDFPKKSQKIPKFPTSHFSGYLDNWSKRDVF